MSRYAADPLNPTDAELAAAVNRGIAAGTIMILDEKTLAEMTYYAEMQEITDREPTDEEIAQSAEPRVSP